MVFQAQFNIYRYDLLTGEYDQVSGTGPPKGLRQGGRQFRDPVISADGRFVAYASLLTGNILLRDMTREISLDNPVIVRTSAQSYRRSDGLAPTPSISADGQTIVFRAYGTTFGPDEGDDVAPYVYLYDAADESIALVSRNQDGEPIAVGGSRPQSRPQISGDGSTVVFVSNASTHVDGDTNEAPDVFAISLTAERCAGMVVTIAGSGEIIGTDGDDVILASSGSDSIYAGAGDDIICALGGGDAIDAGRGDDLIYAGSGNDVIYAGNGRDVVFGGKDDDIVNAGEGNDRAFGGPGTDIVRGNEGADRLGGGPGDDTLIGGPGTDTLVGGTEFDTCKGSAGRDRYFLCEERLP